VEPVGGQKTIVDLVRKSSKEYKTSRKEEKKVPL
jgi:hypothetical protein